jgi:sulfatase maturation enzyme AslB (radical SAM superfamily)
MAMKVLCLGNNTIDTDTKTKQLATDAASTFHGLLSDLDGPYNQPIHDGWYHSSVYDLEYHRLLDLSRQFDRVIMLDQSKNQYSHPDAFIKTVVLVKSLPNGQFLDKTYTESIEFFENLVQVNKSFCIFPFIELLTNQRTDGYTTVCCRSNTPVDHVSQITDWQTNKNYQIIRNKMLQGIPLPDYCNNCYQYEYKGIVSARQQETVEWANRLNLTSLDDLRALPAPSYYEIRPSNICNLQCRMCDPSGSHLIGREYKTLNLISEIPSEERTNFDIVNFDNLKKLYIAGGEPTAMPEFYEFVDKCIQLQQTNFEFLINTNATKLSNRFKEQLKNFSNFQFTVSIDGLDQLNHYIRWPSHWSQIVKNIHYLRQHKHAVSTNTTVSIYNVLNLYDLLKFFDTEFPGMLIHCQFCLSKNDMLSGLGFPWHNQVLEKLLPIQQLKCYQNDKLLQSFIDGLIQHYRQVTHVDLQKLQEFFEFNDKLDQSRNIRLIDYIPELEQARALLP